MIGSISSQFEYKRQDQDFVTKSVCWQICNLSKHRSNTSRWLSTTKASTAMSSLLINYKARKGDTVESIATTVSRNLGCDPWPIRVALIIFCKTGLKPEEILALNKDLKKATSRLVPNKTYLLPRNPSYNSFGSVNDILVEWNARKVEARKDETISS